MYLVFSNDKTFFKCEELPTDGYGEIIKILHKIKLKEFEEKWSINDLKWQYKDEFFTCVTKLKKNEI